MNNSVKNKRIAKNTIILYFRMIFLMAISLYTSRVILQTLGIEDYGIYNVVGGFVSTFAIVCNALSGGCSRFFNYEMGRGDYEQLRRVFSASVTIHVILAIIIAILAETFGIWFLKYKMIIPDSRLVAANWCFQLSLITFCTNLIQVPYRAAIIAHEDMSTFAYVSIFDGLSKLGISFMILFSPIDTLIFYASLLCFLQLITNMMYIFYCRRKYEESKYKFVYDPELLKPILGYSGWNFLGHASGILRNQGGNVLTNMFFGPSVNAARGIANQVLSAVEGFVSNFTMAVNPQISQSYAAGDTSYMKILVYTSARFSYYLLLLISLPILMSTGYILNIWLKEVPAYSALFIQLMMVFSLINCVNNPIQQAQAATGNIRDYQLVVASSQLLILPISYFFLRKGGDPATVLYVSIIMGLISVYLRLIMLRRIIEWDIWDYTKQVLLNVIMVTFTAVPLPFIVSTICSSGDFLSFVIVTFCCLTSTSISVMLIGLDSKERGIAISKVKQLMNRKK